MPDCECLGRCLFFNDLMSDMPNLAGMMKEQYCRGAFSECARYAVFKAKGREAVPKDMFPNNVERARALVGET